MRRYHFVPILRRSQWTPGLRFNTTLGLLPDVPHRIEASTDLVNWQTVTTVPSDTETLTFNDPEAASASRRFYHAVM